MKKKSTWMNFLIVAVKVVIAGVIAWLVEMSVLNNIFPKTDVIDQVLEAVSVFLVVFLILTVLGHYLLGLWNTQFIFIVITGAFLVSQIVFVYFLPDFLKAGGPLVVVLIMLTILVVTFIIERKLTIKKAEGRGSLTTFLRDVQKYVNDGDIDAAIKACGVQRGSCANVLRTGLERYRILHASGDELGEKETMEEIQRAIEEAMMLEVPLLERNLVSLSTIASIATMVGLLGTTIGMIRAFRALAHAGAPDAIQLSIGISEALVNTAGGLLAAICGIVAYNFFATKVDNFTYMIDEASYSIVQSLAVRKK
ncbi:MAG: MotA/TolQ/ExbB proton channel family protein [Bacteroidota bacterium]|nr:MotA/TolQ/ExbB proton channel family protein [Bacteroidota bacterium]